MEFNSIAIDGPSGAGKSTLAKRLAEEMGYLYVDTGAIYRTVGVCAFRSGVASTDHAGVAALLDGLQLDLRYGDDGLQHMYLDGDDVTQEIRRHEISKYASDVSAFPEVRAFLLGRQRELARTNSVIMDGRDIGTVVLPDANVKIFLTATPETRARRRHKELLERGETPTLESVLADIIQRDANDSNRPVAPLRQADGATLVDTTDLTLEESFQLLHKTVKERLTA